MKNDVLQIDHIAAFERELWDKTLLKKGLHSILIEFFIGF